MRTNNWVYFAEDPTTGEIKIGQSRNPDKRLRGLRPGSRILATMCDHSLEHELHERFAHLRTSGEWFRPGFELREYIAAHGGRPDLVPIDEDIPLLTPSIRQSASPFMLACGLISFFGAAWSTADLAHGFIDITPMTYIDLAIGYLLAICCLLAYFISVHYIRSEYDRLARKAYFGVTAHKEHNDD